MQIPAKPADAAPAAPQASAAARERLLHSGLRLFAQQGFAKTSTRELAEAAGVNIASIRYYFGDKAGLYRAVFMEPPGSARSEQARIDQPGLSLEQALHRLYTNFLAPLQRGDAARLCMKLRFRELLEPTGLWEERLARDIQPMHEALLGLLCRHFALQRADDDLRRLAVCIAGLGVHMHVGHDVIGHLAPGLNEAADASDLWCERLVMYALAMVGAESTRRAALAKRTAQA